jgi:glycopeptide antibiotics resistance protein
MNNRREICWRVLWILYLAAMLYLLFLQRWGDFVPDHYWQSVASRLNLRPFASFHCFFIIARRGTEGLWQAAANLVGNVALFIPLGVFLPHFYPTLRKFWRLLLTATAIIIAIESAQLLTLLGSGDIDDVLLNLTGTLLGFALWKVYRRHHHTKTANG